MISSRPLFVVALALASLPVAIPLPISAGGGEARPQASDTGDGGPVVRLQTMHGSFLGVTWGDAGKLELTVDEGCCPPDTGFRFRQWRGLHVLQSIPLGLIVGIRDGRAELLALPGEGGDQGTGSPTTRTAGRASCGTEELREDEVVDVVFDLVASRCVSLRFGKDTGQLVLFSSDAQIRTGAVSSSGLDAALTVVDEELRRHLENLQTEGYTVAQVLGEEEALEARASLERVTHHLTSLGHVYSNGYQIRVPDIALHDALFCDLLVHPSILFLVKSYLGVRLGSACVSGCMRSVTVCHFCEIQNACHSSTFTRE